jgi:PAP2 superfamily protein
MNLYNVNTLTIPIKHNWHDAIHNKAFIKNLIGGLVSLAIMLVLTYFFLGYSQNREGGIIMNDWILDWLPAMDASVPITFLMSSVMLIFILRSITNPNMFLTFLIAYIFILISRIITISITELRAPIGLIDLKDPVCDLMYSSRSITRDLFYSGHTATIFLFYLCSTKKPDRLYTLFATIAIGILVLVQHVHYTIDVVCAPFFAAGCYRLSKKILTYQKAYIS